MVANRITQNFKLKNYYVPPKFKKGIKMKNINKLIKKFFDEQTEYAEMNSDERFEELYSRENYNTAKVLYFAEFCEEYPQDVLEFVYRQGIDDDNKAIRLSELMLTKISNDSDRYMRKLMGGFING